MESNKYVSKFEQDPNYCCPSKIKILDIAEMRDCLPD